MAQGVIYADLRFVKAPQGNSTCSRSQEADEDDAELTYENVRLAQTREVEQGQGAEQSKGERVAVSPTPSPGVLGGSKLGRYPGPSAPFAGTLPRPQPSPWGAGLQPVGRTGLYPGRVTRKGS
uniref:Uncharacterized protein n=1 Tax=Chelonoidis abingdonii TaxID=106734 RepID=A0A8C0H325_CHEAB